MINPFSKFKDLKVNDKELEVSKDFLDWALKSKYDLFSLAFDKNKMSQAMEQYKIYKNEKECFVYENENYNV